MAENTWVTGERYNSMDITIASGSPPCSVDALPLSRPSWYENAYKSMAEQATEW